MSRIQRFNILPGVITGAFLFLFLATFIYNYALEEHSLATERDLSAYTQDILSVRTRILNIRDLEKAFFLTRDSQDAEQLTDKIDETIQHLLVPAAQEQDAAARQLLSTLRQYEQAAHEAVRLRSDLGLDHNSGLEGKLRAAAHSAESLFSAMQDDTLLADLLYLRRHEKDFIMRLEVGYLDAFNDRMTALQSDIVQHDMPPEAKRRILYDLNGYQQSFALWADNRMALADVTLKLDMLFGGLNTYLDEISARLNETRKALTQQGGRAALTAEVSLALAGLVALIFCLLLFRQVLKQRDMANEIQQLAHLDSLTQLSNRRGFADALDLGLNATTPDPQPLLVGLVDLDGFKAVNDVYGHTAGDALLVKAAERIKRCLPKGAFLARLGGDEFGLFLAHADDHIAIKALGRTLCATLKDPFYLKEGVARIGGSIGFTLAHAEDATLASVIERADYALDYSKHNCKGEPVLFSSEHEREIHKARQLERLVMNTDFATEIDVAFQPIVDPNTGAIKGMETLARWHSQVAGTIAPDQFIQLAEKTGKINEITCVVLTKALENAAKWPEDIFVSINLSALDVASQDAAKRLMQIVSASRIAKSRIVFELTETILMQEFDRANETLNQFRALGIHIALDDFGTGYSSLSYLQHMAVDHLKIDRAFIADLDTNPISQRVLRGMIQLCGALGIDCIIEGVEHGSQSQLLSKYGAKFAQGYHFARPMPADEALDFITNRTDHSGTRLIA